MSSNNDLYFGLDFDPESTEPINFLETRFHDLSPFSAHEVELDGITYKTAEHAYQTLRVAEEARSTIMAAKSPLAAWRIGQRCKEEGKLLLDLDKLALMERIFRAKLSQHNDIEHILSVTKDRELRKVFGVDYYWGTGADGAGENQMGKIWMKLRSELN
jgi:ribA/ribD-fused uncharacterized protein